MAVVIVASSEPRAGKSLVAATLAYRMGRDGKPVTLARLAGDDSAAHDAAVFASLEGPPGGGIVAPNAPVQPADIASLTGDVIVEAPAGSVKDLASQFKAQVIGVGTPESAPVDAGSGALAGIVLTRVPAADVSSVRSRDGVIAVLPEDRILAAPSVDDIAAALDARWLVETEENRTIDRVMIGTISSDAASPYFGARDRTCVITRYDKTDVQLAALLTDVEMLVLTEGGEPSPYLLDRVQGTRDDISVVLTDADTVGAMRGIEELYGRSRFDGAGKLERAVELFDEAGVEIRFE